MHYIHLICSLVIDTQACLHIPVKKGNKNKNTDIIVVVVVIIIKTGQIDRYSVFEI